jgi:hypothetical protein
MLTLTLPCSTHHSPIGEWSGGGARSWGKGERWSSIRPRIDSNMVAGAEL